MSRREERDRIEAVLANLNWSDRSRLPMAYTPHNRTLSGILRKAFAPELARCREVEETLARVRKTVKRYPEDGSVPVRVVLAALYGEE